MAQTAQAMMDEDMWLKVSANYKESIIDSGFMDQLYAHFENSITAKLADKGPVHVLDIASASGEPACSVAKHLPQATIISTDISPACIALGADRAKHVGVTNVTFQTASGEELGAFDDNSFDAVTCSLGLMFYDYEKGLRETYRVLKPGGLLAISFWGPLSKVYFFNTIIEFSRTLDPASVPPPDMEITPTRLVLSEIISALLATGFTNVAPEELFINTAFPGEKWFENIVKTPLPLGKIIGELKAAGNENAFEETKAKMEAFMDKKHFLMPGPGGEHGGVHFERNLCHYIEARKA